MTPLPLTPVVYVRMSRAWDTAQQPHGVPRPYGCRAHVRLARARRRRLAAWWGLFAIGLAIALVPGALCVWAWGQYFGAW